MRVSPLRLRAAVGVLARSSPGRRALSRLLDVFEGSGNALDRSERDALALVLRGVSGVHAETAKDEMKKVLEQR